MGQFSIIVLPFRGSILGYRNYTPTPNMSVLSIQKSGGRSRRRCSPFAGKYAKSVGRLMSSMYITSLTNGLVGKNAKRISKSFANLVTWRCMSENALSRKYRGKPSHTTGSSPSNTWALKRAAEKDGEALPSWWRTDLATLNLLTGGITQNDM